MCSALRWRFENHLDDENATPLYTSDAEEVEGKLDECRATEAEIDEVAHGRRRPELPSEIWATIFCACDFASSETRYGADRTSIQCMLSLVCRSWRDIVVSTPQLWVCLPVWEPGAGTFAEEDEERLRLPSEGCYVKLLQLHCERSGALLLHASVTVPLLNFSEEQSASIYKIWESAFPRFKTLDIHVDHDVEDLITFSQLSQHFPNLRSLRVRFYTRRYQDHNELDPFIMPPVSILQHAPLLHQADLDVVQEADLFTNWFHMPWHTLTTLILNTVYPVDLYRIVESAHRLTSLKIDIDDEGMLQESSDNLPPITHHALTTLHIRAYCLMDDVLLKLDFPKLSELDISAPLGRGILINGPGAGVPLVNRSLPSIQLLSLRYDHDDMTGPLFIGMLQFIPFVKSLVVPWCKGIEHLINTINSMASALPNLAHFEITHVPEESMASDTWCDTLNNLAVRRALSPLQDPDSGMSLPLLTLCVSRDLEELWGRRQDERWTSDPLLIFLNGPCRGTTRPRDCINFLALDEAVNGVHQQIARFWKQKTANKKALKAVSSPFK